jgi:hypothetical protein
VEQANMFHDTSNRSGWPPPARASKSLFVRGSSRAPVLPAGLAPRGARSAAPEASQAASLRTPAADTAPVGESQPPALPLLRRRPLLPLLRHRPRITGRPRTRCARLRMFASSATHSSASAALRVASTANPAPRNITPRACSATRRRTAGSAGDRSPSAGRERPRRTQPRVNGRSAVRQ